MKQGELENPWNNLILALEEYAGKRDAFLASHKADYASAECVAAYNEQEDIYEEMLDMVVDLARDEPRALAAALRLENRFPENPVTTQVLPKWGV